MISKIIVDKIKIGLSKHISMEQFGFLSNRLIHDVVGVAQEALHSIKSKNLQALIFKMDLVKAYDRVEYNFLQLVLLQIGLTIDVVDWVMGCVSSTSFAIIVNGSPTSFFRSSKGLRQGCPLSPLLFLLVIEHLSRFI